MTYAAALKPALLRFLQRDGMASAAKIAMSLLLAIFPFTLFALAIAGIISAQVDPQSIVDLIFGTWPDAVAEPILNEVTKLTAQSGTGTITVSLILALVFASNGVDAIRRAITFAYLDTDTRPFWKARLLSLWFVLAGGIALPVVAVLQVVVPVYIGFFGNEEVSKISDLLASDLVRNAVTAAVLIGGLIACHRWLPGLALSTREVLPGVLLTLALWWLTGAAFGFYLANLADYAVTYAGLAGLMAAIIFLNLMAAIFILGAEFNAQLRGTHKP
ncbi:MAG: YihY/virulence factor BrkB family protein [Rhodobacteraceae bacterium]|nr:YihY/virulence factor BrkB family protein [Paracoccaceae bacterium]